MTVTDGGRVGTVQVSVAKAKGKEAFSAVSDALQGQLDCWQDLGPTESGARTAVMHLEVWFSAVVILGQGSSSQGLS